MYEYYKNRRDDRLESSEYITIVSTPSSHPLITWGRVQEEGCQRDRASGREPINTLGVFPMNTLGVFPRFHCVSVNLFSSFYLSPTWPTPIWNLKGWPRS